MRAVQWSAFTEAAPGLATFAGERLHGRICYLGTLRPDGSPRVHPVTPIVAEELFVFMEPTSPKGHDLQRDPRFALHAGVEDTNGGKGELLVRGTARLVADDATRALAIAASTFEPAERYILFSLSISEVAARPPEGVVVEPMRWRMG